jgi:hypothetical protein
MGSARWKLSLEKKSEKTKEKAAKVRLQIHHRIQELENAELAALKDALVQNESALDKGREDLAKALESLNKTTAVLRAASGLLNVVARVLALAL